MLRFQFEMSGRKKFVGALVLFICSVCISGCSGVPSDDVFIKSFQSHRGEYERIKNMAREERGVERISKKFVRLDGNFEPSSKEVSDRVTELRLREYRKLFRSIGIVDGIGISSDRIYFYIYDRGLAGSGVSKGIIWSIESPGSLHKDLDEVYKSSISPTEAWRQIGPEWYLEYDNN